MLISSDDDQVLLFISFTEFVNLKAITLTGRGETRVKELRAFSSHLKRPISDFEEAEDALPHASWLLPLSDASATTSGSCHLRAIAFATASSGWECWSTWRCTP